jgi:hypothetical protein
MKKLLLSSPAILGVVVILASIAIISASSFPINEALAKPHASFVLVPNPADPRQADANPILLVLGHTNEPAFGKLPGIHDGKHNVEVILEDNATLLPIQGTNETEHARELGLVNTEIFVDKFYFRDIESFENADSPLDADAVELDVPISAVFGQPGLFFNRQVIDPGIYGYTLRGVINYYGVANVPIPELTKFCSLSGEGVEDISRFDSPGWRGSYGCPENIKDIFFPPASKKHPDDYPPKYDDGYGNNYGYSNSEEEYENPKKQYQSDDNNNGYGNEEEYENPKKQYQSDDQSYSYVDGDYKNPKEQYMSYENRDSSVLIKY